jgi:hypothetical protein
MLACDTRFEDNNLVWRMRSRKVIVRGLQPHVVSTPEMSTQLRLVRQAMLEQIRLTLVYPSSSAGLYQVLFSALLPSTLSPSIR